MAARTLQEAYQACGEDLSNKEAFLKYYIARENGASLELIQRMLMDKRPVKALLAGQRGAGKTVELMRVVHDTGPSMTPLYIRISPPSPQPSPQEIMLLLARGICERLAESGAPPSEASVRGFTRWLRETIRGPLEERTDLKGAADMLGRAMERARNKETRTELVGALEGGRDELAGRLTEMVKDAGTRNGKEPLLILDGIDNMEKGAAVQFLLESGLIRLGIKAISTIPFATLHSQDYRKLRQAYDMISVQAPAELAPGALALREGSALELRDIVDKRAGEELFELPALDLLLLNSGGSPGELLRFTAASCLRASIQGRSRITASVVERVLEDYRREMRRLLSPEEWQRLARVNLEKGSPVDAVLDSLLDLGAVIEYFGKGETFMVHPALQPLLREKGTG
ncbi:MAG: hypothetical protein QW379_04065 [Thermoplasmata archaeon]